MSIKIRHLEPNDFPAWLPLWDGNNMGHRNEEVTTETWSRITNPDHPVNGLCAVEKDEMVGFVHYILHNTTGYIEPVCYMQDVFVPTDHRKKGIAKKLVRNIEILAKKNNWARIYWLAEEKNDAAQALYKSIGVKLDFKLHVISLHSI